MIELFGYPVNAGDTVYSASMGSGKVESSTPNGLYVSHSGQRWRYNKDLVRSGCKLSDLSWHQKPCGLQIKNEKQQNAATGVFADLALSLRRHYG